MEILFCAFAFQNDGICRYTLSRGQRYGKFLKSQGNSRRRNLFMVRKYNVQSLNSGSESLCSEDYAKGNIIKFMPWCLVLSRGPWKAPHGNRTTFFVF